MAEEHRPRLGRGLAALLGESALDPKKSDRNPQRVPIEFVTPNAQNPRKFFDDVELEELTSSIREKGIIQPLLVRSLPTAPDRFEIIAGERRWRAAQKAGLFEVPVIIVVATDQESLELAIIENVQRTDLNQIDEARGYEQLINEYNYTQLDLSKIIGKSRSHVANTLRLLSLPDSVKEMVQSGALTAGHGRALLGFPDPEAVARKILSESLNVRDVESLARASISNQAPKSSNVDEKCEKSRDPNIVEIENKLSNALGIKISIRHNGNSGVLNIKYSSIDQLDGICTLLSGSDSRLEPGLNFVERHRGA